MNYEKAYTNIEQSKKLAEILPIESADVHYVRKTHDYMGNPVDGEWSHPKYGNPNSKHANYIIQNFTSYETIPCWSLNALLDVLENPMLLKRDGLWHLYVDGNTSCLKFNNPIDACYEMILKLHETGYYKEE